MKKYVIILFAIFFTGAMNSCKDALDLPEDGRISYESIWADRNRTMGYLNACYGSSGVVTSTYDLEHISVMLKVWQTIRPLHHSRDGILVRLGRIIGFLPISGVVCTTEFDIAMYSLMSCLMLQLLRNRMKKRVGWLKRSVCGHYTISI